MAIRMRVSSSAGMRLVSCTDVQSHILKNAKLLNAITTAAGTHLDLRLMQRFMQSIMRQQHSIINEITNDVCMQ